MYEELFPIGRIGKVNGKDQVRINLFVDIEPFFKKIIIVFVENNNGIFVKYDIFFSKLVDKVMFLKFKNLESSDFVKKNYKQKIFIEIRISRLNSNEYSVHDLIGCEVLDVNLDKKYGIISEVFMNPANDIYLIKNEIGQEFLFPAVAEYISSINIHKKIVWVAPIKGMFV
ncbi:MAG: 16S rRNA processing protein RimM [Candidatus Improbicoccus devescovinae]|nr:MAG: 16S rRNA processing protein RimM [Candidatus Improbicoccus devescovinae]